MPDSAFDILILIARPAAGKSETIRYLKSTPPDERLRRFHIGFFQELDDFPMLWSWFEEDLILENVFKQPRLHTSPERHFIHDTFWHVLIERLSLEYSKLVREYPVYHETYTTIIEFSRGKPSGGYREAFTHLSDDILRRAGVMYLDVSFEESRRKNQRRFNPSRPWSTLEHGLTDENMERLYKEDDFAEFSAADPHWLTVKGIRLPYVVFDNHDDVTTPMGDALGERLEQALARLWKLYRPG